MSSQFGFIPKERQTVATGLLGATGGSVIYAAPAQLTTVTTIATAGAVTFSAEEVLGGLVLRDPNGAGRADLLPTAAALVAAFNGAVVGAGVRFILRNTADGAETITLTGNTGITVPGTASVAQNNTAEYLIVFTSVTPGSEAAVCYTIASAHVH
jgi:hypothetical protein